MSEPTRTHPPELDHETRTRAPESGADADVSSIVAPPGYEFLGEIARGGMGVVFRALEFDLGREVAVKVLLPQYAPDSPTARRFLDEARITGRLQHPGIPPIYRVGLYEDGRPYLAMKLIGGRTLEQWLKERTDPDAGAGAASNHFERAAFGMFDRLAAFLESGRFLAIFEHVAQAVGYAHEQGVIHRDLKPANVMVGDFGEVQVMDWGIARSGQRNQETGDRKDGEPGATVAYLPPGDLRTPHSDLTQAGAILGTPAYMPPEQAIGAVDQIGKHSDVFGLGAILCVILTGKPPYVGADAESNRQLAARAKLDDAFARLDSSGAEPELIALAKRCLAAEPKDRPADAGVVWEAVAALRADSERRARLAEMDRARAEVKNAEERKRRKVKYALALSVLGFLALGGFAAWWYEGARAQRRADQVAHEAELTARQVATERDVQAALGEVQVLRKQGLEQADDPARWEQTLSAARTVVARAGARLDEQISDDLRARVAASPSGVSAIERHSDVTDELRQNVAGAMTELDQDERDRRLLVELDRIADGNEIRLLIPVSFTGVTARQYAEAFRKHGTDLMAVPTEEAAAWLKGHRHRHRLVIAIRNWHQSFPAWDVVGVVDAPLAEAVAVSTAVAGCPAPIALAQDPKKRFEAHLRKGSPRARLSATLKAVTNDPFIREWWDTVERLGGIYPEPFGTTVKWNKLEPTDRDKAIAKLKELIKSPEIGRLSARELSSLADGLNPMSGTFVAELLSELLKVVYERFPGEFWVHFRMAFSSQFNDEGPDADKRGRLEMRRHLTAALAIRPKSAVARAALGMELIENEKDEEGGLRWLRSAVQADPNSPWPHLFIGMYSIEKQDWSEAFAALKEAIRVDPDTGFFMTSATALFMLARGEHGSTPPSEGEITQFLNELIAIHPKHPGGYDLLAKYQIQAGDNRAAMGLFLKAKEFAAPDYPGRIIFEEELRQLESKARWGEKLPAVLRGEIKPANNLEVAELAGYCANFERKYALATRIVIEGIKYDPKLQDHRFLMIPFAGYAVQAGTGHGADAATTPLIVRDRYRRQALEWMNESLRRAGKSGVSLDVYISSYRDFAPVRDEKELARLPAAERTKWEELWHKVTPITVSPRSRKREVAPPPRVRNP